MCNQLSILCDAILALLNFFTKSLRFCFQLLEFCGHNISEFLGTKPCIVVAKHVLIPSQTNFGREDSKSWQGCQGYCKEFQIFF